MSSDKPKGAVDLESLRAKLAGTSGLRSTGSVQAVTGPSVRVTLPSARIGDVLVIRRRGEPVLAEIVGFDPDGAIAMPLGALDGVGIADEVESLGRGFEVSAGSELLGRVLDGLGRPLDGRPLPPGLEPVRVDRQPPSALERRAIERPFSTGVRAIDAALTLGEGQRIGLFAGSGVGKSMLLGSMARGADCDVVVVALVGERGREVGEFLEQCLGKEGLGRAVVVVATSDAAALERLRAAQVATAIAEWFRDEGKRVLLLVDSVTRVARAQREVGLAAGEPPARRGYPPSTFAFLPRLLERSGQSAKGAITAFYTVLVEGGDMDEPIADEVRGILDGHIVLERSLAARGHYPAIDLPASLSRVMPRVVSEVHALAALRLRELVAAYEEKRDLIVLGAYKRGSDALVDAALAARDDIDALLRQAPSEHESAEATRAKLLAFAERHTRR